jgi:hypothetical protein
VIEYDFYMIHVVNEDYDDDVYDENMDEDDDNK